MNVVFFDVETTGLNPVYDKVIELAYYVCNCNGVCYSDDYLIRHDGLKLSDEIVDLTGITDSMLIKHGTDEKFVAGELFRELGTLHNKVWVAHNTQFDLSFIKQLLLNHISKDKVDEVLSNVYWLDTLTILRDRKSYPHTLKDMVKHYLPDKDFQFHRAIDDARAVCECLPLMIKERDDLKDYINVFGYHPTYGVSGEEHSFIEYHKQAFTTGKVAYKNSLPNKVGCVK